MNVYRAAAKIRRKLKNKINVETITAYAESLGYSIIIYDLNGNNAMLECYKLTEYAKKVEAFTFCKEDIKIIFVNNLNADKLSIIIHELAHIVLRHLKRRDLQDDNRIETEAEAFTYALLNPPRNRIKNFIGAFSITIIMICVFCVPNFARARESIIASQELETVKQSTATQIAGGQTNTVYITPSGNKFHRANCIYVKNKDCIPLPKEVALKTHLPCKVCNP